MSRMLGKVAGRAKVTHCRNRQSKQTIRQPLSAVMQKVKGLLPSAKAAHHLHILTDQPLSTCEKVLCGQRGESTEMLTALLRSALGRDVLFAVMNGAAPDWFARYRKQLDVNLVRKQLAESQRLIEQLQREAAE